MKLVGMMLVRNEEWIIEASVRAAMQWCDAIVIGLHACTDRTHDIVRSLNDGKFEFWGMQYPESESTQWNEMDLRQYLFAAARKAGGTHFAIIDADEILTADFHPRIRGMVSDLKPGQLLEVPMLSMRTLDEYQDDATVWSNRHITLAFADRPDLTWKPGADGYQHHHRQPHGSRVGVTIARTAGVGGVMHLQFANQRRLLAKHVLYRMVDHLRWPNRESMSDLNRKYDQALQTEKNVLRRVESQWWEGCHREKITLDGVPWQEEEIRRLLALHGRERFAGLDLKGF